MIRESINGFCMALADSVPGVSGGTIAFIMGFYDNFIGSIHDLVFGAMKQKRKALRYLTRLGFGWIVGMMLASFVLAGLFESHIYTVSSVFIGFIIGSIPIVIKDEIKIFSDVKKGYLFLLIGIVVVVALTVLNSKTGMSRVHLDQLTPTLALQLFIVGAVAISAMFLPGISGSTILLIFGMYIPIIQGIKNVLSFDFSCIISLFIFGLGILIGAMSIVKWIQYFLKEYRVQMLYLILGMMVGSLYAIMIGPTTLEVDALSLQTFDVFAALIGFLVVCLMHKRARR